MKCFKKKVVQKYDGQNIEKYYYINSYSYFIYFIFLDL